MVVFFGIAILIAALLCFVLKITVNVDVDILKNSGAVVVRLFFIKVFSRTFSLDLETLQIKFRKKTNKKPAKGVKKANPITHNSKFKGSLTLEYIIKLALKKIEIRNMDISLLFGIKDDAFATCIGLGLLQNSIHAFGTVFNKKHNTNISLQPISIYSENVFKLNVVVKNYICVIRIIKALFIFIWHKISKVARKLKIKRFSKSRSNIKIYANNR